MHWSMRTMRLASVLVVATIVVAGCQPSVVKKNGGPPTQNGGSPAQSNGGHAPSEPSPPKPGPAMANGKSEKYAVVPVFYATDRKVTGEALPAGFYGTERGPLDLGVCEISIPRDHRMGKLESPSILKLEFHENPARHIVLLAVTPLSGEAFYSQLGARLEQSQQRGVFVFVHGFNVTFEDAARRTAQIAYDLGFNGAPILYSWPSQGALGEYTVDETNVEWTIPHLKLFLKEIVARSGARTIHLIAHSMGNRALARALQEIALEQARTEQVAAFREIVLTAPDIDAEVFQGLASEIKKTGARVTLYASSNDEALRISQEIHGNPRAGESGDRIVVLPGMDTVDVSAVDTSLLGHSYYGDNRSVLADLFRLLQEGKPPGERPRLLPKEKNGLRFWEFQP